MSPFIDRELPGLTSDTVIATCSQPNCTTEPKDRIPQDDLQINCSTIIYFEGINRLESVKFLARQHFESHQKDESDPKVVVTTFAHVAHNHWKEGSYPTEEAISESPEAIK